MEKFIILLSMIAFGVHAEELCKDFPVDEGKPFVWEESDFNQENAARSLSDLKGAMERKGQIGTCGLPNALDMIEGYILKQQVLEAISDPNNSEIIKNYALTGFCEFVRNAAPCE